MIVDLGRKGAVAELADALDLGSSSLGSAGSIPVSPTFSKEKPHEIFRVVFLLPSSPVRDGKWING